MERSEDVTETVNRIMKMIDRSNAALCGAIDHFENPVAKENASLQARPLVDAISVVPKRWPSSVGFAH